jgi:sigma-B regulation protein RsbU (phosphoserine phosphatase)
MDELQAAYAIIKKHSDRMEQELNVGHDIQMSMLPLEFPAFPERSEFSLHATLKPAREVGGDFYDFFFVDDHHLCLVVGDVSGKGVPAALFMAVTKTMIKSQATDDPSPASIITRVNDDLSADNPASMFVTLFIAIVNTRTGEFRFTNAGHNPPYILRSDEPECLDQRHGPIIGAVEGVAFREDSASLNRADTLLIFTDGVTEAMSPADELYSEARLEALLTNAKDPPEALAGRIIDDVEKYAAEAEQADDITILAYRAESQSDASEVQTLQLSAAPDLKEIERVNSEFQEFALARNVPPGPVQKVCIVLDELLNNIISYGFDDDESHEITVDVAVYPDHLLVEVSDDGIPFNPFDRVGPDVTLSVEEREIGGLGVLLVTEMMDEYHYQRHKNKNSVTMTLKLQD